MCDLNATTAHGTKGRLSRIRGKQEWDGNGKQEWGQLTEMPDKGYHTIYKLDRFYRAMFLCSIV